jgi:GTP cyclohydrolase I
MNTREIASLQTPPRADAQAALRNRIHWAGENPEREGLRDTPLGVARAHEAFLASDQKHPDAPSATPFEKAGDFDAMVPVRNLRCVPKPASFTRTQHWMN